MRAGMKKITPFLWFNDKAEEAAKFYASIFKNSKVLSVSRSGGGKKGPARSVSFRLEGQHFLALNGGPHYAFTPAISLYVNCKTQREVDTYWRKLTAGGGKPSRCGWLVDRYGLSWQIIPATLGKLLGSKDPAKAGRVMEAMLAMDKLDLQQLTQAADRA